MENYSHEIYRILSGFSFLFYATEILSLKKQNKRLQKSLKKKKKKTATCDKLREFEF